MTNKTETDILWGAIQILAQKLITVIAEKEVLVAVLKTQGTLHEELYSTVLQEKREEIKSRDQKSAVSDVETLLKLLRDFDGVVQ